MIHSYFNTKLGPMMVATDNGIVYELEFLDSIAMEKIHPDANNIVQQLKGYAQGGLKEFSFSVKLEGTDFQKQVWVELMRIPYGETRTYKEIAEAIGNPKAVRAIGMANNKNKVPIIIPCHRVIGSDGSLTGYAYGLDMKKNLLQLEKENKETL